MSSDPTQTALTEQDLQQFFAERGKNWKCEVCEHSAWAFGELGNTYQTLGTGNKGSNILGPHVPLVIVVCTNCGYVRPFARNLIAQWKQSQGGNG